MGETADLILDGILCQYCGVYIDDEESEEGGPGYPRSCSDCEGE